MTALSTVYGRLNLHDKAFPLIEKVIEAERAKYGDNHVETIESHQTLAVLYEQIGNWGKVIALREPVLVWRRNVFGPNDTRTNRIAYDLAAAYAVSKQFDKALPLYEDVLRQMRSDIPAEENDRMFVIHGIAKCLWYLGDRRNAIPYYQKAYDVAKTKYGPEDEKLSVAQRDLAVAYIRSGEMEEAMSLTNELMPIVRQHASTRKLTLVLRQIVDALVSCQEWSFAEDLIRNEIDFILEKEPALWDTYDIISSYGELLVKSEKFSEAEPMLLNGYEGLVKVESTIPGDKKTSIPKSLDRLIDLYSALDNQTELLKYRALRENYPADTGTFKK